VTPLHAWFPLAGGVVCFAYDKPLTPASLRRFYYPCSSHLPIRHSTFVPAALPSSAGSSDPTLASTLASMRAAQQADTIHDMLSGPSSLGKGRPIHGCPCLTLIRDVRGAVFGCFNEFPWALSGSRFYGNGESFVFSLSPHGHRFGWDSEHPRRNVLWMRGTENSLTMGGGMLGSAIYIGPDLAQGQTSTCETFSNTPLVPPPTQAQPLPPIAPRAVPPAAPPVPSAASESTEEKAAIPPTAPDPLSGFMDGDVFVIPSPTNTGTYELPRTRPPPPYAGPAPAAADASSVDEDSGAVIVSAKVLAADGVPPREKPTQHVPARRLSVSTTSTSGAAHAHPPSPLARPAHLPPSNASADAPTALFSTSAPPASTSPLALMASTDRPIPPPPVESTEERPVSVEFRIAAFEVFRLVEEHYLDETLALFAQCDQTLAQASGSSAERFGMGPSC